MSAELHPVTLPAHVLDHAKDFWDDIILNADGSVCLENVYAELSDYEQLMMNVTQVYSHITCGNMSKPAYHARDVIQQSDECVDETIHREIRDVLERLRDGEELADLLIEYPAEVFPNVK